MEPGTGNTQVYTSGNWTQVGGSRTHSIGDPGDYSVVGSTSYSRKKPKVEEEVVDETVEEWEEEREDGTKVIVRKRTKRTKTTTTRDLYEPNTDPWHWQYNPNQWTTINTGVSAPTTTLDTNRFDYSHLHENFNMKITDEQVQKLMEQLKVESNSKTAETSE